MTVFKPASPQSQPIAPTSQTEADGAIAHLVSRKQDWLAVGLDERIAYLERCLVDVMGVAAAWAAAASEAKGIAPGSQLVGEEWLVGPVATLGNLRQLIETLKAKGQPAPIALQQSATGQTIAHNFPRTTLDRFLWPGYRGEVWIEPGQPATQGKIYRQPPDRGQVALVLGAGNIASIGPMDTLHKLFAEDQVVLLKMNPVNEYLGPFLEQGLRSLIQAGFLKIVYGGAEVGAYLCQHPQIDTVHITGSHQTHDAIVWGDATEQAERKANQQPKLTKPITSELGCVTPVLVVPGRWSRSDLAFQARQVASAVAHNASFNCAAAKVLVVARGWAQREEFLQQVRQALAKIPPRQAYYPGAQQRYQAFLDRYPQAQPLAPRTETIVPWTVIPDVPPQAGEYALTTEAFCGVLAEVSLEASTAEEFLQTVVPFANEKLWGTLSCMVLIDRATQRQCKAEFERAIADLRYGGIGVNVWSPLIFSQTCFPWGAFPGHPLDNIGSGRGMVHNTDLFEHPQKAVLYAPFRLRPTPPWFANHRNLVALAQSLAHLQVQPSLGNLERLLWAGLRG